ncbi:hypothetical protein CIK05_11980 [Bdellovibrio sp. qaytius]|nr:hypothetical protein CIK05_11980 [Bdellovibrio sp. qaytius]
MISKKTIMVTVSLVIGVVFLITSKAKVNSLNFDYIVTETSEPDSFDPLNADKTQNLTVMRMLYFTPFEVDKNNLLKSSVFDKYDYDSNSSTLTLEKKSNIYFDDGTPIEVQDILIAILRMGYFKPDFPMIKDIIGIEKWSQNKKGLLTNPVGIEVSGVKIIIKFRKKMLNPMFRLCLELFSIVPSKCIDLETGKFNCDIAPSSGYFRIASKADKEIVFEKRNLASPGAESISANKITFKFKKIADLCKTSIGENVIVAVSELDYISSKCDIEDAQLHWMAASRFGVLRFNTKNELFSSSKQRSYFSEQVRKQIDLMNLGIHSERSLLSQLLPGYLEKNDFPVITEDLRSSFKGRKISLVSENAPVLPFIYKAVLEAAKSLDMDIEVVNKVKNEEILNDFLDNRISVIAGASGFWAQDPVGDISMWFTKNLHKTMTFVWEDKELYSLLKDIEDETVDSNVNDRIKLLNKHIYSNSIIAPLIHFRRLYITNSKTKNLNLPQAITSPAPWQISL